MIEIHLEKIAELQNGLKILPEKIKIGVGRAISTLAFIVEREAKLNTPVDTGRLMGSIRADYITLTEASISPHTDYAFYVHEGKGSNRKYGRRPFMEIGEAKANEQEQEVFNSEIEQAVKDSF